MLSVVKCSVSQQFIADFGIPQGAELSPKLFNLFINDVSYYLNTHLAVFADDTCVFSANNNRRYSILAITKHLKLLFTWFAKWRVALNDNKTESILFFFLRLRQESRDNYKIALSNTDLPWSNQCKYLGVILDQGLTFKQRIHTTNRNF